MEFLFIKERAFCTAVNRLLDVNVRGIHFSFKVALNDEQCNRCFWSWDLPISVDFGGEGQF